MAASDPGLAVNAIYQAAASAEFWPDALALLADHVGANGGFLIYAAPGGNPNFLTIANVAGGRLREDLITPYFRHYASNPYAFAFAKAAPNRVYVANTLVNVPSLRRSAFHDDILVPQVMHEQIVVPHASLTRGGSTGGISFVLSGRRAEEAKHVAARVARLVPHFTRAIDINLQLGRYQSGSWQIDRILDAMPGAALLLDRTGGVIRANSAADALLRQADGLCAIKGDSLHLRTQSPMETHNLVVCIGQALAVARGDDQTLGPPLQVTRPSGRPPLIVLVTPLPPAAFSLWEAVDGGARVLVQIVDPQAPTVLQAEQLRRLVGLTPTEARVAALIGAGMSAPEAAAALGISINTVKTHLARCFDKAGVNSQAALARLLASIPAQSRRAD